MSQAADGRPQTGAARWPAENLSVRRQCALLNLARSGVYRPGPVTGADDLALMRRIDELHLKWPFYGSRRMVFELNQAGHGVNRKRVQRLMRVMGIEALVPRHHRHAAFLQN
jgi:putative transposase